KAETIRIIKETLALELEELLKKSSKIINRLNKELRIICKECSSELLPKKPPLLLSGYI
ncbi:hypothetical protein MNBD_BACTEROID06-1042, partial [hydrothermal vent metagenome]